MARSFNQVCTYPQDFGYVSAKRYAIFLFHCFKRLCIACLENTMKFAYKLLTNDSELRTSQSAHPCKFDVDLT